MFQYSFCSYSTCLLIRNSIGNPNVSIQLLFLFNAQLILLRRNQIGFNTASVLIQLATLINRIQGTLFQYSFCSYSTEEARKELEWQKVSIQLLFLFNREKLTHQRRKKGFNTASVLIQQISCAVIPCIVFVSIQLLFLFNRKLKKKKSVGRKVSIQLLFLFNVFLQCSYCQKLVVSIQLLFLFNILFPENGFKKIKFQYSFCSYSTRSREYSPRPFF